ncbi:MAG: ABC-2 family transporter protein [Treponema sp.]|jgi:ABC-2 type transport system permease protein|nr:ABC-2 family transporter protein [Treponema sp.]
MKKYFEMAKILFKVQIAYRFDVAMTALATVGRVLFAWILWGAVFSGRERVGGFTYQTMLAYYLASSFLTSLDMSAGLSSEIAERIRNGTFSKFMVIPAGTQRCFMSQNFGAALYYAVFSLLAAAACAVIFRVEFVFSGNLTRMAAALLMEILGLVFMASYQYFIGILAFKFQDIGFFLHVQGSLLAFATGTMAPLSLLPPGVTGILRRLPFYYVTYLPAMLLTGQNGGEALPGLITIAAWTTGMLLVSRAAYRHLRVHYDGVGI